jgi:hypothetical protein
LSIPFGKNCPVFPCFIFFYFLFFEGNRWCFCSRDTVPLHYCCGRSVLLTW